MKKKLKKNLTLTASQMKMRMEKATPSLYTDMMKKLPFNEENVVFLIFFSRVTVFTLLTVGKGQMHDHSNSQALSFVCKGGQNCLVCPWSAWASVPLPGLPHFNASLQAIF
jgi:hypothetical protein